VRPWATVAPQILGDALAGAPLTVDPGSWEGSGTVHYSYSWQLCEEPGVGCNDIPGATSTSYVPTQQEVGSSISVEVTASNDAGDTVVSTQGPVQILDDAFGAENRLLVAGTAGAGTAGLWSADPTGAAEPMLLTDLSPDGPVSLSADASTAAFAHDGDLYITSAEHPDQPRQLRRASGHPNGSPTFSSDGERIAFQTEATTDNTNIATMSSEGGGSSTIINWPGNQAEPQYAPDGTKLVFTSDTTPDGTPLGGNQLFVANANGSDPHQLTETSATLQSVGRPRLSPDGQTITFAGTTTNGKNEIFTVAMDGSALTELTSDDGQNTAPDWLPDGNAIVFHGPNGLARITSTGGDRTLIDTHSISVDTAVFRQPANGTVMTAAEPHQPESDPADAVAEASFGKPMPGESCDLNDPCAGAAASNQLLAQVLAEPTFSSTNRTHFGWGLSDQTPETWDDPDEQALNVKNIRLNMPWNIAVRGPVDDGNPQHDRESQTWNKVQKWMQAAQRLHLNPIVSFDKVYQGQGRDGDVERAPTSVEEYLTATRAFRRAFPFVHEYTAWNEPNLEMALQSNPRLAGRLWQALSQDCNTDPATSGLPQCVVAAGDFSDHRPSSKQLKQKPPLYRSADYLRLYKDGIRAQAKATGKPQQHIWIWAYHSYGAAQRTNPKTRKLGDSGDLRKFLAATSRTTKVWLTEQGGMIGPIRINHVLTRQDTTAQALATQYLLTLPKVPDPRTNRRRITRFYYYQWSGDNRKATSWDSGLIDLSQKPRKVLSPSYCIFRWYTNPLQGQGAPSSPTQCIENAPS
jgi:Tol biopolymer transport system component